MPLILEIIVALLLGVGAGIFTGLTPGIHVNLVSVLLLSLSSYFLGFTTPLVLSVFIIAMAITHTFLDAIPSVFLGAPDSDMALGVLPGHQLLLEGRGYEAVKLTVIGSLLALIFTLLLIPVAIPFIPFVYNLIQPFIGYILILVVVFMVWNEPKEKKIWSFFIFFLSGILGMMVLTLPNLDQPLLPLLSGLFGISTLLISLNQKNKLPKQIFTEDIKVEKSKTTKAIGAAVFSGSLTGLFPGLGAAEAAIIAMQIVGDIGNYAFMILIGGINTVNFLFSLVALYTIQKARNGAIVVVLEIIKEITLFELLMFLAVALIVGGIATWLTLSITKKFAKVVEKVDYKKLTLSIIAFVTLLVFLFSGFMGLLILMTSTALGMVSPLVGVKRSHAMGCLMLPVILFFVL